MKGTKGIYYYRDFTIMLNYYEEPDKLNTTNDSSCCRLIFIEDGVGSIWINQDKIEVLPMTCLCLNENDRVIKVDVTDIKLYLVCFLPSAINSKYTLEKIHNNDEMTVTDFQDIQFILPFLPHNKLQEKYRVFPMDTSLRIKDILLNLKEMLLVQNDSWPCLTRSYLIELLYLVERTFNYYKADSNRVSSNTKLSTDDILRYLHNNYMEQITIGELVKRFNTNRTTLTRDFKKATGYSIISYVLKIRTEIAAGMLRDTSLNIAVIIERVGFHNITHFNKVFKEHLQCLPSEYRKKCQAVYKN